MVDEPDELERILSGVGIFTSPIEQIVDDPPTKDAVADLEDDSETQSVFADLRTSIEDLKQRLNQALDRANKLDHDIDGMVALTSSAHIRIRMVLALAFLKKHSLESLAYDADDRIADMLQEARTDLEKAEIQADRMPF